MPNNKKDISNNQQKEIFLLPIADTQVGSTTGIHPNFVVDAKGKYHDLTEAGGWFYKNNPHYLLNSKQLNIWTHYQASLKEMKKLREGKKLVVLMMGDAIDGDHHGTHQLVTKDISEQVSTHIALMKWTMEQLDWRAGDILAYVKGTEVHVHDEEERIAQELNAHQYDDGAYTADFLEIFLNGVKIWAFHHGVKAGDYPNRGEALMRQLRRIYYKCRMKGEVPPDLVVTAHVHDPAYATFTLDWHTIHGVILPSLQEKTRYANEKVPLSINKIGLQAINISAQGKLFVPKPSLLESPLGQSLKIGLDMNTK